MAKTNGHTMHRYLGDKLYLANIARRKATFLADNGLCLDVAPFWMACPVRGCDCAECALGESYSDSWAVYPMTRDEMTVADYFAELRGWHRDEDWYRQLDQEEDEANARTQAEAARLVVESWLAGVTLSREDHPWYR